MEGLCSVTTNFAITKPPSLSFGKVQYQSITLTQKPHGFFFTSRNNEGHLYRALSLSRAGTEASSSCRPISNFADKNTSTIVRTHATGGSSSTADATPPHLSTRENRPWMVLMQLPSDEVVQSKENISNYYVVTLQRVLGSDMDAQSCIYDLCCDGTRFGFCCDINEETARALAGLPEVMLVKPDPERNSVMKDYSLELESSRESHDGAILLFPVGSTKHWLVRMDKQMIRADTRTELVDYYTRTLSKVLGNERDAQMCIYHVSLQSDYGFCCELDEECAKELTGVPGVLSVQLDENFDSEKKDYRGDSLPTSTQLLNPSDSAETTQVSTKKLFITGLSFYTSEKTLRAAFEPFGELVEVKVIMDKISKRSKGYAFVEYTTEEAASAALKEMNGKIINGWMIVVDVAKSKPRYSRGPAKPRY